jgi:signal transduction histidine kinase
MTGYLSSQALLGKNFFFDTPTSIYYLTFYALITLLAIFIICYLFFLKLIASLKKSFSISTTDTLNNNNIELFFPNSITQLVPAISFHLKQLIHENHRVSTELNRLEREYRSVLDTQSEIVFLVGDDGFITYKNKAFDLFFEHPTVKTHHGNLDDFQRKIARLMEELEPHISLAKLTGLDQSHTTNDQSNGKNCFVNWKIKQIKDSDTPLFLLVGRDETPEILLREEKEKLEKVATVGRAASTIFHEINQPLAVIQISAAMIQEMNMPSSSTASEADSDILNHTEIILAQINRITQIVRNLRLFHSGEQSKIDIELFKPNPVIQKSIDHLNNELTRSNINLCYDPGECTGATEGNPELFSQVIINIIQNSLHALASMPNDTKKNITITTEASDKTLFIVVVNNGECIPAKILDKVTEPFFTTKSVGSGSGLGLSLCLDIITKMGGSLKIENITPRGVKTTIALPRHKH